MEDTDKFNYSEFYYNGPDNDMEGLFVSLTSNEINIVKNKLERFIKLADYIQDNYKELYGSTSDDTTSIAKKMAYEIYDDLLDHANYFCKLISDLITSSDIEKECDESKNAINILGGKIKNVEKFNLPNSDILRNIVIIDKIKETPNKYPRKPGTPAKEPIK